MQQPLFDDVPTPAADEETYDVVSRPGRWRVRDLPVDEQPLHRLAHAGARAMTTTEVLAALLGTADALDLAAEMTITFGGLAGIARASLTELQAVKGVGKATAARIKAALELGRRTLAAPPEERPRVTSPADAANLLMPEMMLLEQEHLRLILLDTRNTVLGTPTIYIGSLNTSVVRLGELFRAALRENAAALIVVHNHPSGEAAPSPEDVHVTRQLVRAGDLLDVEVLDHVIIGRQRYVSLKERGLGFE